jgi:hypothetical protein
VKLFFPLIGGGLFVQRFHDLYILLLTMLTPDPVLPRLKIAIFHHLVTVRAAGGKRINGYLPLLRHDNLI